MKEQLCYFIFYERTEIKNEINFVKNEGKVSIEKKNEIDYC